MYMTALIFFLVAAIFGAILFATIFKNKTTSKPVAVLHGSIAVLGLLILATFIASGHYSYYLFGSLIVLGIAAIGGFTMFAIDLSGKPVPKIFAVVHPLLALTGIALLVIYFFQ